MMLNPNDCLNRLVLSAVLKDGTLLLHRIQPIQDYSQLFSSKNIAMAYVF